MARILNLDYIMELKMFNLILICVLALPLFSHAEDGESSSNLLRVVCTNVDGFDKEMGSVVVLEQMNNQYTTSSGAFKEMSFDEFVDVNTRKTSPFSFKVNVLSCKLFEGSKMVDDNKVANLDGAKVSKIIKSKACKQTEGFDGSAYKIGNRIVFQHRIDDKTTVDMAFNFSEIKGSYQKTKNNNYNDYDDFKRLFCTKPFKVPADRYQNKSNPGPSSKSIKTSR